MALIKGRKSLVLIWVLLLGVIANAPALARAELVLDPANAPFDLAPHAEILPVETQYLFDPALRGSFYPLEPILGKAEAGAFEPIATRQIGTGVSSSANYLRVPVRSVRDSAQDWVLAFNQAGGYYYKVYLVLEGQKPPDDPIFEYNFVVDRWDNEDVLFHTTFTMPAQSSGYLYVVFDTLNGGAPMTIETVAGYAAKRKSQDLQFFAVVGLALGLVVITVALMATLKRFVAIYYAGAVLSGLLVVLVSEQYMFVLFPGIVWIGDHDIILPYAAVASPVFALLFQRQFFADAGGTGKFLGRLILGASLLCIVGVIGLMEFEFYPPELLILALAISIPLISINGFIALLRGYAGGWPFFFGALVFSGSFLTKVLSYEFSGLISSREASLLLLYALALEATALSVTMFLQVRHMRFEKERALQDQVAAAKAKLKMAQSLSHAAHDIQQPLSSLRLALSSSAAQDDKEQDFHRAIDYLEAIVNRQLHEMRRETNPAADDPDGPVSELNEAFEVNVVLNNMAVMFADEAREKGLGFRVVPSRVGVHANVFAVMRVMSNLVSNAIRNTEQGGVLVGCRRQGAFMWLEVVDTGRGMSMDEVQELRQPYVRKGDYPGNGLGLGIVRQLCSEHGFGFEVESRPQKGSRFRIRLPRA